MIRKVLPEHFSLDSPDHWAPRKGFSPRKKALRQEPRRGEDSTAVAESQGFPPAALHKVLLFSSCLLAPLPECSSSPLLPWGCNSAVTGLGGWAWLGGNSEGHSRRKKRKKNHLQKLLEANILDFLLSQNCSDISRWCNETSASAGLFRVIQCEEEEGVGQNQLTCCVRFLLGKISKVH